MLRFVLISALVFTLAQSSPLGLERNGQVVVDIPAGVFDSPDSDEIIHQESKNKPGRVSLEKDVQIIPVQVSGDSDSLTDSDSSIEDVEIKPQRETDFFGFRLPQLFVYRRPVIRDPFITSPFSSFPVFQQQPPQTFTPAQPSQFNVMSHMEAMMKRMQEQMSSLWGALSPNYNRPPLFPRPIFNIDSASSAGSESGEKGTPDILNIDTLPANYSNSTSETKLVDGQLVTVNKTIHKISSNDSSGFFQVQVIKIRPQAVPTPPQAPSTSSSSIPTEVAHEVAGSSPSESSGVKKPESPVVAAEEKKPSSAETLTTHASDAGSPTVSPTTVKTEDPSMNEIDHQQRETSGDDLLRFRGLYNVDDSSKSSTKTTSTTTDDIAAADNDDENVEQLLEEFQVVPLERYERTQARSLADDTRINKILMEDSRKSPLKMINPDVEVFIL